MVHCTSVLISVVLTAFLKRIAIHSYCYDLDSMLSRKHTLVLSDTRELDRVSKYKTSTLYTKL